MKNIVPSLQLLIMLYWYKVALLFACLSDWNLFPLNLCEENQLLMSAVVGWFHETLPDRFLGPLVVLMVELFQQPQVLLRHRVHEVLSAPPPELQKAHKFWHANYCKAQKSFEAILCKVLRLGTDVDGFFIVIAAALFRTHVAIANLDRLWTMRADGYPRNYDLWMASTSEGLHEIQVFKTDSKHIENL